MIILVYEKMFANIRRSELQTILKIRTSKTIDRMVDKIDEAIKKPELNEKLIELIEE
jgi:hypothetical protein